MTINYLIHFTPYSGIKGTAKPVFYRTIWNENSFERFKPSGSSVLTKEKLQTICYGSAFLYSTATRCPRLHPLLLYCTRLANVGLGFIESISPPLVRSEEHQGIYVYPGEAQISNILARFSPDRDSGVVPFHPHLAA
jgi:hypothetical protein